MKLPNVWPAPAPEIILDIMRLEARKAFCFHSLASEHPEWETKREQLRQHLIAAMRLQVDHSLPLDLQITGEVKRDGYIIRKIYFQAAENRCVTGNLYIPDGHGPFPAVLNLHGHWQQGRLAERVQARGHVLALNGYICLCIDAFGSGERATFHGEFEPHGGPRGGLLSNIGEPLIGIQVADNMRALDLLCSLPEVDAARLGVTGASGGGNQTMYLTALDDRVKAALSVCSVGTFESYIGGHNCICETLVDGLHICEEAGVIALIAPRAYAMLNGIDDEYSTFTPREMLRTYRNAREIYRLFEAGDNLQYKILPSKHGYHTDALEYMLGFFNFHLKAEGHGLPYSLPEFQTMAEAEAMVFPQGARPEKVRGILSYCALQGEKLKQQRNNLKPAECRNALEKVLNCSPVSITDFSRGNFEDGWEKITQKKSNGFLTPALLRNSTNGNWRILAAPYGKQQLPESKYLGKSLASDDGLLLIDLFGTGETGCEYGNSNRWDYHDISRSCFWLGWTMLGEWVRDYTAASRWLSEHFQVKAITYHGFRDTAVAALLAVALYDNASGLVLENAPVTLNWSNCIPGINTFTLALCVTDILHYGDIPDFAVLASTAKQEWITPVHGNGIPLTEKEKQHYRFLTQNQPPPGTCLIKKSVI